jgi:PDZ domain/Trypsin
MGVISSASRQISPGNSGGPLIDPRGEVIGINTFIVTESGGSEGLGFAIPSNLVRDVYGQLKKYGRVRRGELGVAIRTVTPALVKALGLTHEQGILVQDVTPGKEAATAGVRPDDIVLRVEGRPVRNIRQFANSSLPVGDRRNTDTRDSPGRGGSEDPGTVPGGRRCDRKALRTDQARNDCRSFSSSAASRRARILTSSR